MIKLQRLEYPFRVLDKRVKWDPSSRVISAPVIGCIPMSFAMRENSIAPQRLSWSVKASAGYPRSIARTRSSSTEDAPS